jgi:hypothetical protein
MKWGKPIVIVGFSALYLVVSIMRVPASVPRHEEVEVDVSWVVGLPEALHQGSISGRDFHFTYGPIGQVLAFAGAWFHQPWSPFDALALIMLAFYAAGIAILAMILGSLKQLDWKVCAFIYLFAAGLNLFAAPTSFRALILLLCSVLTYRILDSRSESAMLGWAAVTGCMCVVAQLITVELGLYGLAVAVLAIGSRIKRTKTRILIMSAGVVAATYVIGNVLVSAFFAFSSAHYTHFFDYQRYALEMIRGYNFAAGLPWELTARQTIGLTIVVIFTVVGGLFLMLKERSTHGPLLLPLLLSSIIAMKSAFIRSDIGHIAQASSPLIFTFLLIGALFVLNLRSSKTPALVWGAVFGILWFSWPWAGPYFASDIVRAVTKDSPIQKLVMLRSVSRGSEEVLPAGLAAAVAASPDTPMLAFPHEYYIVVKLQRRILAPVFPSFNASTDALQRFYVEQMERRGQDLDVVYGMDDVASRTLESVQSISRVPIVFDYLYKHFRLASEGFGRGFYLLRRGDKNREFIMTEVAIDIQPLTEGGQDIHARNPSSCSLIKLDLQMKYSLARYFGRPTPVDLTVFQEGTVILTTRLVAIEPNAPFSSYVSLLPKDLFYKVFGNDPVPLVRWDTLRIEARPSDWIGVQPSSVDIQRITCVSIP